VFFKVKITGESQVAVLNNSDLALADLQVNGERMLDVQGLVRAEFVTVFDRRNRKKTITFNTQQEHEGIAKAMMHAFDHDQTVPAIGLVEFHVSDGQFEFKRWMKNAGIDAVEIPRHLGVRTWQRYRIIGGEVLKQQPLS
jgi:hypothetical protein